MKSKVKKLISIALSAALVMSSVLIPGMHSQAAKGGIAYDSFECGTYGETESINYLYHKTEKNVLKSCLILDGTGEMPDIPYDDTIAETGNGKLLYEAQGWYGASFDPEITEEIIAGYDDDAWQRVSPNISEVIVGGEIPNIGMYSFLNITSLEVIRLGKSVTTISKGAFRYSSTVTDMYIYGEIQSIGDNAFDNFYCTFHVASQKTAEALEAAGVVDDLGCEIDLNPNLLDDTPLRIALKKGAYEQKEHPDGEGYTEKSWTAFTEAMASGQTLLDAIDKGTASTTESEINKTAADIEAAISGLIAPAVLEKAIAKAAELSADDYTPDSWTALQTALEAGKSGLNTVENQTELDALASAVENAIKALEPKPTATPTAEPTATPTAEPTATPTAEPTAEPTAAPTAAPTAKPTAEPTATPTAEPTAEPTAAPTAKPTAAPTAKPTAKPNPTVAPAKKNTQITSGNFVYKVTKEATAKTSGTLTVTALSKAGKKAGKLSVLATTTIEGYKYKVTKLGNNALKGAAAKSVTLGKNITAIPKGAFSGCKKLSTLTVNAKLKSVKKGAFKGCKKKIKVKGGTKKTRKSNITKLKKSGYKKFK